MSAAIRRLEEICLKVPFEHIGN